MIAERLIVLTAPNISARSIRSGESHFAFAIESNRKHLPSYQNGILQRFYASALEDVDLRDPLEAPGQFARAAERLISTPDYRQMFALIYAGVAMIGSHVHVCHVGDIRVHLLSPDLSLKGRTRDHNLIEDSQEATDLPHLAAASIWTRALQLEGEASLEFDTWEVAAGDRVLICSSGFHRYRDPSEYVAEFGRADDSDRELLTMTEGYFCLLENM